MSGDNIAQEKKGEEKSMKTTLLFALVLGMLNTGCGGGAPKPPDNVKAIVTGGIRQEAGPFGFGVVNSTTVQDVEVSWGSAESIDSYNIYWSTTPKVTTTSGKLIDDIDSPYVHKNLTEGETYYFVVTSVKNGKESLPSQEVSAKVGTGSMKFNMGNGGVLVPAF